MILEEGIGKLLDFLDNAIALAATIFVDRHIDLIAQRLRYWKERVVSRCVGCFGLGDTLQFNFGHMYHPLY